jgi:hypothetical protein
LRDCAREPRSSIDADIVIDMREDQVEAFVESLGTDYYADADSLRRAIRSGASTNLVHRPTGIKVDLFTASSLLDRQQLARRRRVQVGPDRFIFVHSPEDILLQKLHWFRAGRGVSERHGAMPCQSSSCKDRRSIVSTLRRWQSDSTFRSSSTAHTGKLEDEAKASYH